LLEPLQLHSRALELAGRLGQGATHDSHYLALAETLECDLWTADQRFRRAAGASVTRVRSIGVTGFLIHTKRCATRGRRRCLQRVCRSRSSARIPACSCECRISRAHEHGCGVQPSIWSQAPMPLLPTVIREAVSSAPATERCVPASVEDGHASPRRWRVIAYTVPRSARLHRRTS
jgi:hypothetical protein